MVPERLLATLLSFLLALASFPVAIFLATVCWLKVGGSQYLGGIVALAVGTLAFVFTLWKAPRVIRRLLDSLALLVTEPMFSCVAAGVAGALLTGSVMLTMILLLGHTRPGDWEIDAIPRWMGIAFLISLLCGLPLGLQRKRHKKISD